MVRFSSVLIDVSIPKTPESVNLSWALSPYPIRFTCLSLGGVVRRTLFVFWLNVIMILTSDLDTVETHP